MHIELALEIYKSKYFSNYINLSEKFKPNHKNSDVFLSVSKKNLNNFDGMLVL